MTNHDLSTGSAPRPVPEPPLLRDVHPDFCAELIGLLHAAGEPDLGGSAFDLRIVEPCGCGDSSCESFYTAPRPGGAYGPGHRNVLLSPQSGMIVLDVVHHRIMFVEVVDHPLA